MSTRPPMDSLSRRISRISGQLRGIYKMVEENRSSTEILQQISAVKKAINGMTSEIVSKEIDATVPDKQKKHLKDLFERAIDL